MTIGIYCRAEVIGLNITAVAGSCNFQNYTLEFKHESKGSKKLKQLICTVKRKKKGCLKASFLYKFCLWRITSLSPYIKSGQAI